MNDFHRLYAFVELQQSDAAFVVKAVKSVPYQTVSFQTLLIVINHSSTAYSSLSDEPTRSTRASTDTSLF